MWQPSFIIFLILFSLKINAQISGKFYSIKRVSDGDTVVIQDELDNQYKIRFIGIDAPESRNVGNRKQVQVFGSEAKNHLKKLLFNKKSGWNLMCKKSIVTEEL